MEVNCGVVADAPHHADLLRVAEDHHIGIVRNDDYLAALFDSTQRSHDLFKDKRIIWIVIGIVIILLGGMTMGMLKEMKKKEEG